MRFMIDGLTAVATKDNSYRQDTNITSYTITLFENRIERDTYYVTLLDVNSQKEAMELLKQEVQRQRDRRKNRDEKDKSVLDDLIN